VGNLHKISNICAVPCYRTPERQTELASAFSALVVTGKRDPTDNSQAGGWSNPQSRGWVE